MKTSEFIRKAVDKYLVADFTEWPLTSKASMGLCGCFSRLEYDISGCMKSDRLGKLAQEIEAYRILENASVYFLWSDFLDPEEFNRHQQVRFMFAEFLALQFEDLGD